MAQLRGLNNFISDIRNCKTEDEEKARVFKELAKIRKEFGKKKVDSYSKRKYMWKVMYMYILGYQVDFGHMQCVDLIRSDKYAEKLVGYVGVSLLLIEYTEMLRLCIQTIKDDLESGNEVFQCLALSCIANVGGAEFSETLTTDVQQLLVSPMSLAIVRKKAALCLLRLIRQNPDNLPSPDVVPKIVQLTEVKNIGVVSSVMSLLTGLCMFDPREYSTVVKVAINWLSNLIMLQQCHKEYVYNLSPDPWIVIKLLRILTFFPPTDDVTLKATLQKVLDRIVQKTEVTQNPNKNYADHAVLFEAINVIIHLNMHGEEMLHDRAIHRLTYFINVKDPNIRYVGLDVMSRLAKISGTHKAIQRHLRSILLSLSENDISIRKRALDLLYSICDEENVVEILDHLLSYLVKADYNIREEMVLKIAILTEKFATDLQWYINVIIRLITIAGDFVSEDVWHRVIQIITNHEELQKYAAETIYEALGQQPIHECLVNIGGYILGEFGHLLESVDGMEQFKILHVHFPSANSDTKRLLLSTYMKFANMFDDELVDKKIDEVFKGLQSSIDPELQQRAVEYSAMMHFDNQDLITTIWDTMPDYPDRGETNLMKKVKQSAAGAAVFTSGDEMKVSTSGGGDDEGADGDDSSDEGSEESSAEGSSEESSEEEERKKAPKRSKRSKKGGTAAVAAAVTSEMTGGGGGGGPRPAPAAEPEDLLGGLFGGGGGGAPAAAATTTTSTMGGEPAGEMDIFGFGGASASGGSGLPPGFKSIDFLQDESLLHPLFTTDQCVFFDGHDLKVGFQAQLDPSNGIMRVVFFFANTGYLDMEHFKLELMNVNPSIVNITLLPADSFNLGPSEKTKVKCRILLMQPLDELPMMKIQYLQSGEMYHNITCKMPVVASKFFTPHSFDATQFKDRWSKLTKEKAEIIQLKRDLDGAGIRNIVQNGMHMGLIEGVDSNANNCVACAVYHFATKKEDSKNISMPVLLRVQLNPAKRAVKITAKSPHDAATASVAMTCRHIFGS